MKTIVVYEFNWGGHFKTYFLAICRSLVASGYLVKAFCPYPEEVEDELNGLALYKASFSLSRIPIKRKVAGLSSKALFDSIKLDTSVIEEPIDLVFICCIWHGAWLPFMNADKFPYNWKALLIDMHGIIKNGIFSNLLNHRTPSLRSLFHSKNCKQVFTLEEDKIEMSQDLFLGKLERFPEICSFALADSLEAVDPEGIIKGLNNPKVGILGCLNKSKYLVELITIAKLTEDRDWGILAGGPLDRVGLSEYDLDLIDSFFEEDDKSFAYFGNLNEELYNLLLNQCDLMFLCYRNFYRSSNNLVKAAYYRKPVICMRGGTISYWCEKYGLGQVIPKLCHEEVTEAFKMLLDGYQIKNRDEFLELHKFDMLAELISR